MSPLDYLWLVVLTGLAFGMGWLACAIRWQAGADDHERRVKSLEDSRAVMGEDLRRQADVNHWLDRRLKALESDPEE